MTSKTWQAGYTSYLPLFLELHFLKWKLRFGFEYSRVGLSDIPYLDRYILYFGRGTLRLHKFWRGDDDRAPHDHPWWFITMPFVTYREKIVVPDDLFGEVFVTRLVRAWRPHFRAAKFQHIVIGRRDRNDLRPFWTLVISGGNTNDWGFWPEPGVFVPYKYWRAYVEEHNL